MTADRLDTAQIIADLRADLRRARHANALLVRQLTDVRAEAERLATDNARLRRASAASTAPALWQAVDNS